jgi:hypothetical protein
MTATRGALTTSNGLQQNGLTTNGLIENGFWQNGFWQNGFWQNGFWQNGFWQNGFWQNGFWQNGFWQNGFWQNGFWQNGFWQNGLTGPAAVPGNILRSNAYARELLQYIYSCAMPATTYDTTLDPNNWLACSDTEPCPDPTNTCSADGKCVIACSASQDCPAGYACTSQDATPGTCVIPLQGGGANGSGLAVNADGTTWWGSGTCDENCQRWISACVLSRTNAYGVHVRISLRAPIDAPQAVRDALATTTAETQPCPPGSETDPTCGYTLREGAYYGNIFETTPVLSNGQPASPPATTYVGPATGLIASTPVYTACAGPGSNIPQLTKRFCSSQGDQVVIGVPGMCLTEGAEAGVCAGTDAAGAMEGCRTGVDPTAPSYDQVITVYLKKPIVVCGNNVCEDDGTPTSPETATSCPNDCHPETWAQTFTPDLLDDPTRQSLAAPTRKVAVGVDGSVVIADMLCNGPPIDIDGDGNPATNVLTGTTKSDLILAKYDATGKYQWGVRTYLSVFDPFSSCPSSPTALGGVAVQSVSVASDGTILVSGFKFNGNGLWAAKFTPGGTDPLHPGTLVSGWPLSIGGSSSAITGINGAIDTAGDVAFTGSFSRTATFGPMITLTAAPGALSFVAKLWSNGTDHAGGPVMWAVTEPPTHVSGIAFSGGDVVASMNYTSDTGSFSSVYKLDGTSGGAQGSIDYLALPSTDPNVYLMPEEVATDTNGDIYVTGPKCLSGLTACNMRIAKYSGTGPLTTTPIWTTGPTLTPGLSGQSFPYFLAFDGKDQILVGGYVNNMDFGAGLFDTFQYANVYVASYATADTLAAGERRFHWAKQIPMILGNLLGGFGADGKGHVILGGVYSGSMQLDDVLLVNAAPEKTNNPNMFIGRFAEPADDTTPPEVGVASDETGLRFSTVPEDIVVEATSPQGAVVFFMPPTALDDGNAGTTVACTPRPNTLFKIKKTPVTCVASDPHGNQASTGFNVTVIDTVAPVFSGVGDITVQATSASGANVPYTLTAYDQVDLGRPLSCSIASGSLFPVGTTSVTCTASDKSNNQASATFNVVVTAPPIAATCVGAPGAPVTLATAPGTCGASVDASDAGSCSGGAGGPASCTFDGAPAETLGPGDHAVVVLGTAASGATASCTSYVRVLDGEKPAAICAATSAECTGGSGATVSPLASCTDNCGCTASCMTAFFPLGASLGSCVATDPSGNTSTCAAAVTVVDTKSPTVTPLPGPSQLQCNVDGWADPGATAVDICAGDLSGVVQRSGAVDPTHVGTYVETYSASDPSGNVGAVARSVAVVDTLAPTLTLNPSAATLQCGVTPYAEAGATATDVCAGDLSSKITVAGAVNASTVGTYTLTYGVADPSGNATSASRVVSVVDTTPPIAAASAGPNAPPDRYITIAITSYSVAPKGGGTAVTGSATCWTSPGVAVTLTASDACALKQITYALAGAQTGGATVAGGVANLAVTKVGSTVVSYSATDKAMNPSATQTLPVFVGFAADGFGFACAPSPSLKGLPAHGTVTAKGTATITNSKTGKQVTGPFSFTQTY